MKQVIRTGTVADQDLYWRLYGAGLVRREGQRINPANLLYARFFRTPCEDSIETHSKKPKLIAPGRRTIESAQTPVRLAARPGRRTV